MGNPLFIACSVCCIYLESCFGGVVWDGITAYLMQVATAETYGFVGSYRWNRQSQQEYNRHAHSHKGTHFGTCPTKTVLGSLVAYAQDLGDVRHLFPFKNIHSLNHLTTFGHGGNTRLQLLTYVVGINLRLHLVPRRLA